MNEHVTNRESKPRLQSVRIQGFKSLADVELVPTDINILIGPNGAGKSNFISFFRMLSWSLASPGQLPEYVARSGGASLLLCDGPETTREIGAQLQLETKTGINDYEFRLVYAADDTMIYTEERYRFSESKRGGVGPWISPSVGHREAQLVKEAEGGNKTAQVVRKLLQGVVVYQFHNTSETSRIRGKWNVNDNRYMKEDGGNLAAVLLRLQDQQPTAYHRIVELLRNVIPYFADFELHAEHNSILLGWRELGSDRIFTASQASDGMLRLMALVTLLNLPLDNLPAVLVLDEPELGLHPAAINVVAGLIRSVSAEIQVIAATQSLPLIDCFAVEDIVVVERGSADRQNGAETRHTTFKRLNADELADWTEDYSLSELYEKNVIGGRP